MRTLDPQALSQHVDRLYRAAWALCGSREDAEDLVQETRCGERPRANEIAPGVSPAGELRRGGIRG
jgi:hypothetical protein